MPSPAATACQVSSGLSTSSELRLPVAVGVPGVPLLTPPASTTLPVMSPVTVGVSFCAWMVTVMTCVGAVHGLHRQRVGQRIEAVERLHRRIGVVEGVGPHPGRRHLEGAEAVVAGGAGRDRASRHRRIVDVGRCIEIAGVGRRAGRAVGDAAGLGHVAGGIAGDAGGVVLRGDGDGDDLRGAVLRSAP